MVQMQKLAYISDVHLQIRNTRKYYMANILNTHVVYEIKETEIQMYKKRVSFQ